MRYSTIKRNVNDTSDSTMDFFLNEHFQQLLGKRGVTID